MIDYLLVDQPIICISTDIEEYEKTRGFYFDKIEDWIPTKVLQNQKVFLKYLNILLNGDSNDPFKQKREDLKNIYFTYHDAHSTERLVEHVFYIGKNKFPNH
jgi:CDP-glycerol glycerophosphotransferase (TagB/SpsB family)